jgi:hypothetical protein
MRTALLRLLPAVALALPLAALTAVAQDKPTSSRCPPRAGTQASPVQQTPYTPPQVPGYPEGPPEGPPPFDSSYRPDVVCPNVTPAPATPTLEEMVQELKQVREREKNLTAAIREKVKAQRKALDDAEREVNGDGAPWSGGAGLCW